MKCIKSISGHSKYYTQKDKTRDEAINAPIPAKPTKTEEAALGGGGVVAGADDGGDGVVCSVGGDDGGDDGVSCAMGGDDDGGGDGDGVSCAVGAAEGVNSGEADGGGEDVWFLLRSANTITTTFSFLLQLSLLPLMKQ